MVPFVVRGKPATYGGVTLASPGLGGAGERTIRNSSVSQKIPRHAGKFSPCLGSTLRDYLRRTERAMIEASGDAVRAPRGVEDSEMHAHQEAGSGTAATSPRTAAQNPADRGAGTAPGPGGPPPPA